MKNNCYISEYYGSYKWSTEYYHNDNSFTMGDFMENHLTTEAEIIFEDGSYAEVRVGGTIYALDAKGDGDSYNHIVEWSKIV